jgi:uncharacterized protein
VAVASPLIPRRALDRIKTALGDTRVVLIAGPRQAGKTTLARGFEQANRPYFTLDDAGTLEAARADPSGFVRGLDQAIIDEIQRAPDLILAIKESVDRDPRPGRFLLTGSASVTSLPAVADSLAGRMQVVTLLPLAQAELRNAPGTLVEHLFAGQGLPAPTSPVTGDNLIETVLRGGYPEALRRANPDRRRAWQDAYVSLILDRDVREIAHIDQLDRLPRLLAILAEHAGQLLNQTSLGAPLSLSHVTAGRYVSILERLYLVTLLAPWSSNALNRLVKTPKLQFLDTGLLSALRGDDADEIRVDRTRFGPLLESFVISEVMKLASWSEAALRLSHFRTKEQEEVDLVIEDRRGRVIGIEVKATATVRAKDFAGLRRLQAATGPKFVQGLLLHDHDRITPFGERLHAAPISLLWTA